MMELHILCDGYVREGDELRVGSTVGFVRDADALVVIDPGMVAGPASILDPLLALGVAPGDVTDVVISHHHPDHTVNVGLFPAATRPRLPGDLRRRSVDRPAGGGVRALAERDVDRDAGTHAAGPHDAREDGRAASSGSRICGGWPTGRPTIRTRTMPAVLHANRERVLGLVSEIVPGPRSAVRSRRRHASLIAAPVTPPKLILILSENWTMTSPRDLPSLVRIAVEAEDAGFDAVMVSEHVVLGSGRGLRRSPRQPSGLRASRQPGSRHAVAGVADAPVGRGRRHDAAPPGGRRDHPAAQAPAAAGEGPRDARPPVGRASGRAADRELASRGVRGARCRVRVAGRVARRAPRGVATSSGTTRRRRSRDRTTGSTTCSSSRSPSVRTDRRCGSEGARCTSGSCGAS